MTIRYFTKSLSISFLSPSDAFIISYISKNTVLKVCVESYVMLIILDIIFKLKRHDYSKCFVVLVVLMVYVSTLLNYHINSKH